MADFKRRLHAAISEAAEADRLADAAVEAALRANERVASLVYEVPGLDAARDAALKVVYVSYVAGSYWRTRMENPSVLHMPPSGALHAAN